MDGLRVFFFLLLQMKQNDQWDRVGEREEE